MSEHLFKNIGHAAVHDLAGLVDYAAGQVVSRTLAQTKGVTVTVFAFAQGEGLSAHKAGGDAMVQVLDGSAAITVGEETFTVNPGQVIVMPKGVSHALEAKEQFKMLLTLVLG